MDNLITTSEAASIIGCSEYALRKMDEEDSFPAIRTEGGHRRYDRTTVEQFALRRKHKWRFDVILKMLTFEQVSKGADYILEERWRNRHVSVGVVKKSNWKLGKVDKYCYYYPEYPKVFAYSSLHKTQWWIDSGTTRTDSLFDFDLIEPYNSTNKYKNLIYCNWSGTVNGPNDRKVHKWYAIPNKYIAMACLWNYGHPSLWEANISCIPDHLFLIVDDEAFEEV